MSFVIALELDEGIFEMTLGLIGGVASGMCTTLYITKNLDLTKNGELIIAAIAVSLIPVMVVNFSSKLGKYIDTKFFPEEEI
jgi:hypothetical protein